MQTASKLADDFLNAVRAEHRYARPAEGDIAALDQRFFVERDYIHGFSATLIISTGGGITEEIADIRKWTSDRNSILVLRDNMFYHAICECDYGFEFANL